MRARSLTIHFALIAILAAAGNGSASIRPPLEQGLLRGDCPVETAQVVVPVPSQPSACSCGAFMCKGKDYPACSIQCSPPQAAGCECGYCERTLGSPNSGQVGPVANLCECR